MTAALLALLYFVVGIVFTALWQSFFAKGGNKGDEGVITVCVFLWPVIIPMIVTYYSTIRLTSYFDKVDS